MGKGQDLINMVFIDEEGIEKRRKFKEARDLLDEELPPEFKVEKSNDEYKIFVMERSDLEEIDPVWKTLAERMYMLENGNLWKLCIDANDNLMKYLGTIEDSLERVEDELLITIAVLFD